MNVPEVGDVRAQPDTHKSVGCWCLASSFHNLKAKKEGADEKRSTNTLNKSIALRTSQ